MSFTRTPSSSPMLDRLQTNEASLFDVFTIVYVWHSDDKQQKVLGNGGQAELHICKQIVNQASKEFTYRLVGQKIDDTNQHDHNQILNCRLTQHSTYKRKSQNFHKFTNALDGNSYGFGFHNELESLQLADEFYDICSKIISDMLVVKQPPPLKFGLSISKAIESSNSINNSSISSRKKSLSFSSEPQPKIPLGKLSIHPAKPLKDIEAGSSLIKQKESKSLSSISSASNGLDSNNSKNISCPSEIFHKNHATCDILTRRYEGIPHDQKEKLHQQFGIRPSEVETIRLPSYKARIPSILVQMKEILKNKNGMSSKGIFRVSAEASLVESTRQSLLDGSYTDCKDVNCIAALIKSWFRKLPESLLNKITYEDLRDVNNEEKRVETVIHRSIDEPNQSIFLWLLDFLVDVALLSNLNSMNELNLATVFAPNLQLGDANDNLPCDTLQLTKYVIKFVELAICQRRRFNESKINNLNNRDQESTTADANNNEQVKEEYWI